MKKMTKRMAGIVLGTALAFTVGAGVYSVYDAYGAQETVTASAAEKTVIETQVTAIQDTHSKTNPDTFLIFYLSENDYSGDTVAVDKTTLEEIQYYDYILMDGQTLGDLVNGNQNEVYYNLWGLADCYSTRWPQAMIDSDTIGNVEEIKVLAGCQFPAQNSDNTVYEVKETVTYVRTASGEFADASLLLDAEDIEISMATVYGSASELYKVTLTCDSWNFTANPLDYNYSGYIKSMREMILLNGRSLFDINENVDDSAYVYSTYPMNILENEKPMKDPADATRDLFANPTTLEAKDQTMILYIHKDYVDSICKEFGDILTLTVKEGYTQNGKALGEDVSATIYGIGYDLTLIDGEETFETLSVLPNESLANLPSPTGAHKTFVGWVDEEGNPAAAVMPNGALTLYAKWSVTPYTLTIVYPDETTKTFTFGVELDEENGVEWTLADLETVLEDNLPAETETTAYGYAEKMPNPFKPQDYTFTVTTVQSVFTITFTDEEGNDIGVAPVTFTKYTIDDLVLPAVPEKEGYKGEWNKTTDRLKLEDVTLYAVYTEIKETPNVPDAPNDSEDENDSANGGNTSDTTSEEEKPGLLAGCFGVVGGVAGGLVALGMAAVTVLKKKED